MQSGKNNTKYWTIDFSTLAKGHRWENQLIGWQGTSDNMQAVKLRFFTLQQAIDYATRHGLEYSVKQPTSPKFKVKTYKQNFVYNPDKLRMIYTK
ncbi:NADH-ubiquinone oxidoreductase 21 kDa subunit, mitochondrial [Zancudomyces culisetae]|uniref:NADH dehydrogenase [ubiquinone] iron-sulfur protein 4, mitochondrial n=1 Tax=Zancudomyces culisetae TaxID=1213189 RepID=A0A1R1PKD1_ZANCU|nr:NADH-ubiquinone oxidoreductase 21 kDa subunit, mitochondrial [Zancudomyces culisetae]|eukprot:OMH81414.1 NADH-ubiquinone oxidoreductase 21 kDa subunit, mitochondrial [Zancudomyces culisetae]